MKHSSRSKNKWFWVYELWDGEEILKGMERLSI